MNSEDRDQLIRKYNDRLDGHGDHPLSLGWTRGKQSLRFNLLLKRIEHIRSSLRILDFGCGFADLYGYLRRKHPGWEYLGVDINSRFIEIGATKHPEAKLEVFDTLDSLATLNYDYAVASGVFNSRISDNEGWLNECMAAFSAQANVGFAINFISTTADIRHDDLFYRSASDVAIAAQAISRRFAIDHSYMPFEFTLYVWVNDHFDKMTTVYPEFETFIDPSP